MDHDKQEQAERSVEGGDLGGRGSPGKATLTSGLGRRGPSAEAVASAMISRLGLIQRKADGTIAEDASHAVDRASAGPGMLLPAPLRERFERSLDTDLSGVRVHADGAAAAASEALGARAYALGQDVFMGAGQYQPDTTDGQFLIAHEVAHTVQQRDTPSGARCKVEVSEPGDALERDADAAATAMLAGTPASVIAGSGGAQRMIMRWATEPDDAVSGRVHVQTVIRSATPEEIAAIIQALEAPDQTNTGVVYVTLPGERAALPLVDIDLAPLVAEARQISDQRGAEQSCEGPRICEEPERRLPPHLQAQQARENEDRQNNEQQLRDQQVAEAELEARQRRANAPRDGQEAANADVDEANRDNPEPGSSPQCLDAPEGGDDAAALTADQRRELIRQVDSSLNGCSNLFQNAANAVLSDLQSAISRDRRNAELVFQVVFALAAPGVGVLVAGLTPAAAGVTAQTISQARRLAPQASHVISALGHYGKAAAGHQAATADRIQEQEGFLRQLMTFHEQGRLAISHHLNCLRGEELLIHWQNYTAIVREGADVYERAIRRVLQRFDRQVIASHGASSRWMGNLQQDNPSDDPPQTDLMFVRHEGHLYLARVGHTGNVFFGPSRRLMTWVDTDFAQQAAERYGRAPERIRAEELADFRPPPRNTATPETLRGGEPQRD